MRDVSLAKAEQTTWRVLLSAPQNYTKMAITKVKKRVGWTFDRDNCYCKGAAKCQNLITSYIIPLGVMYLLVIMLDQYKVSVEHHWI